MFFFRIKVMLTAMVLSLGLFASVAQADSWWSENPHNLQSNLVAASEVGKKGVFVFFEMDDCPFCERMENEIFTDEEVRAVMQSHFELMKINIESSKPVVLADGSEISQKTFAQENRVHATPVMFFYNAQGELLTRYVGPTRTVAGFLELVEFVTSGAAEQPGMNFRRFQQKNR